MLYQLKLTHHTSQTLPLAQVITCRYQINLDPFNLPSEQYRKENLHN